MKRISIFLTVALISLSIVAQVTIPFDVPLPSWKILATPTSEGQLFKTLDLKSDILVGTEGPEWDTYDWHAQTTKPLGDGEFSKVLLPGYVLPVRGKGSDIMAAVEFGTWPHGLYDGYTQFYGLEELKTSPVTYKDLEESSEVVCLPDNEGNIYVILQRGSEEHFGWGCSFYIGRLKKGYVVFPYTCYVERNIDSEHSGILNGKLGNCDLSKFTMRDAQYILNHAERIEDDVYAVMYAALTDEGRRVSWFETRLVGDKVVAQAPAEDNKIYTQVEEPATYQGGTAALLTALVRKMRYPTRAAENNIQGKVVVRFVVEKDGSVTNPEVIQKVDPDLDREALRVVGTLGKMSTPGKINGRPVRSYYSVPLNFKL